MKQKQSSKDESDLKITVENTLQQKEDAKQMFPITFDFCFYFEVNGPNRFHFLFKVPLPSKFIAKSIYIDHQKGRKTTGAGLSWFCLLQACCYVTADTKRST